MLLNPYQKSIYYKQTKVADLTSKEKCKKQLCGFIYLFAKILNLAIVVYS